MAKVSHTDRIDAPTVLLADDDEDFRSALAELLDEDGCDVVAVPNGAAAPPFGISSQPTARRLLELQGADP